MSRKNTKQWFMELRERVESADLDGLRTFLAEQGFTKKMNLVQSRKKALEIVDRLQDEVTAKASENAAKRKSKPIESELTRSVPVIGESVEKVVEITPEEIRFAGLDVAIVDLRQQLEGLRKQLGTLELTVMEHQITLTQEGKKTKLVTGDLEEMVTRAKAEIVAGVTEALKAIPEKKARTFKEVWDGLLDAKLF